MPMDAMTEPAAKPKNGRPFTYTDEAILAICDRVAGGELLTQICAEDDMPSTSSFFRWLDERADLREAYTRARRDQAEVMVDDMVRIADTEPDANRARVRVMTRQWLAERLNASKYGAKMALTDADGGPLAIQVVRYDLPAPKDVTPQPQVIEHRVNEPLTLSPAQPIDKTEDSQS